MSIPFILLPTVFIPGIETRDFGSLLPLVRIGQLIYLALRLMGRPVIEHQEEAHCPKSLPLPSETGI